jgi:hypothetical protein
MLFANITKTSLNEWKKIWNENKDLLKPNRKSGQEIQTYIMEKYILVQINDEKAKEVVTWNILNNECFSIKLPKGAKPDAVTYYVSLDSDKVSNQKIFVGIDLITGYYTVEGSESLWDELYAFRGLDEDDIQNPYCVAEYLACLKKFPQ